MRLLLLIVLTFVVLAGGVFMLGRALFQEF